MARRGRPKGANSEETRTRIIAAARCEFASRGFDGASIATIAGRSELAPSAVYHYFGGKVALYEEVFAATVDASWSFVDAATVGADTLLRAVKAILDHALALTSEQRGHSNFLALVPMEASLHPEFEHLVERRTKHQDVTFGAMAELGVRTGELKGFDIETGTEMLRSLIMGWFFETQFRGEPRPRSAEALVSLVQALGNR